MDLPSVVTKVERDFESLVAMPFYPIDAVLGFGQSLGVQEAWLFLVTAILLSPFLWLFNVLRDPRILTSVKAMKHETFASIWRFVANPVDRKYAHQKKPLLSQVHGTVLDVGTGTGVNLRHCDPTKIDRIICIEPNKRMHPSIHRNALKAGFRPDQIEIVPYGAEEFDKVQAATGLSSESVDCVTSMLALCTIPNPRKVMAALYSYLKPGGTFFFFEHVASDEKEARHRQDSVTPIWTQLFDGCELNRTTDKWLFEDFQWAHHKRMNLEHQKSHDLLVWHGGYAVKPR